MAASEARNMSIKHPSKPTPALVQFGRAEGSDRKRFGDSRQRPAAVLHGQLDGPLIVPGHDDQVQPAVVVRIEEMGATGCEDHRHLRIPVGGRIECGELIEPFSPGLAVERILVEVDPDSRGV